MKLDLKMLHIKLLNIETVLATNKMVSKGKRLIRHLTYFTFNKLILLTVYFVIRNDESGSMKL